MSPASEGETNPPTGKEYAVRHTGGLTALLAALPSLIGEEERWVTDRSDPHCVHVVDLTTW